MRRSFAIGLAFVLALTLSSATGATEPGTTSDVSGAWSWVYLARTPTLTSTGDMIIDGTETGTWTGTFEGASTDVFRTTRTPPFGAIANGQVWGEAWGALTVSFSGRVDGKNGDLTMWVTYQRPANSQVPIATTLSMSGTWTIIGGTEALKDLSGSGTWVSSASGGPSAAYGGTITWGATD